ncbi:unnamed protein product [Cylicocyclus nassatus]|uniref:Uncharacterized protein n=1 Tax=Cylicocyclus nassatus TaxID=53992 RepID=A0AA36DQR3_CYLNA|nr:unnamed protein product [Cylicocyclus nassatus]
MLNLFGVKRRKEVRVRDFRELADIQCVNGEWRHYSQGAYDKVLRHVVCYQVEIPHNDASIARKAREAKIQSSCHSCSSLKNYTEFDLCPSESNCSAPFLKSLKDAYGCEDLVVECPHSSLAVQLKSGSSMVVYPQDIYCDEVWIYDDGKHSHEVQGMLCLSKEHKEKYLKCASSCPSLKQICPACDVLDDLFPNCTSRLNCGMDGNVVVSKRKEDNMQDPFQAYSEDNMLLLCVNGSWIVNINETKVQIMDDELIYCKSLNISSFTKSSSTTMY